MPTIDERIDDQFIRQGQTLKKHLQAIIDRLSALQPTKEDKQ